MKVWILLATLFISISFGEATVNYPLPTDPRIQRILDNFNLMMEMIVVPTERHFRKIDPDFYLPVTSWLRIDDLDSYHSGRFDGFAIDTDMHLSNSPITNYDVYTFWGDSLIYDQRITHRNEKNPSYLHIGVRRENNRQETLFETIYKTYFPLN